MRVPTDALAWYAAITATVAIIWDVYKWRHSGPRLRLLLRPNQIEMPGDGKRKYLVVEVQNVGDRSTTIRGVTLLEYGSRGETFRKVFRLRHWAQLRWFPSILAERHMVVNWFNVQMHGNSKPPPTVIEPGAIWSFQMDQAGLESEGRLYVELLYTHRQRPIRQKLTFS